MPNQFVARNGIFAQSDSQVTGSLQATGSLGVTGSVGILGGVNANLFMNPQTITANIVVPANTNALLLGPANISSSVTLGTSSSLLVLPQNFTSFATTGSNTFNGSQIVNGDVTATNFYGTASVATTASFALNALSASYAPDTTFPYTGSARITGSLTITGSANVLGGTNAGLFMTPQTMSANITVPNFTNAILFGPTSVTGSITLGTSSSLLVLPQNFTSFATTSSNTFNGNQIVNGDVTATNFYGTASVATTAATASSADTFIVRNNLTGSNALFTGTVTAVSIVETSALRYKDNIQELNSQLDKINQLKPVEFDWKTSKKHDIGFIAEEVDKIYPEIVSKNEAGEVEGISYSKMVAALVKAMQEQQEQIVSLTREVNNLKNNK